MSLSRSGLWLFSLLLVTYVVAHPDNYKYQDTDSNKEINLLDILKDYEETDREHQQESEVDGEEEEEPEQEKNENNKPENEKEKEKYVKEDDDDSEEWKGRWLPHRPNEPKIPPKVLPPPVKSNTETTTQQQMHHDGRIPMGIKSSTCDDGKTNLTTDWNYTLSDVACFGSKLKPHSSPPKLHCKTIPKNYVAEHKCMYDTIEYDEDIPLFGTHRPIWPVYGEYFYIPKQRWLHSLEHGAIVMLYHPCANKDFVSKLKSLVKSCLRRHIITPYNLLEEDRPVALLSWGCILSMSQYTSVEKQLALDFISTNARNGPEGYKHEDGDFSDQLLEKAAVVSDLKDSDVCSKVM